MELTNSNDQFGYKDRTSPAISPERQTIAFSNRFANKGPYIQSYGFSSSHVWMWELDHKEAWGPKNSHFRIVKLRKTLESSLDSKEIKQVNSKGNQPWIFIRRTDAEAGAPILWPPDVKCWLTWKDPDAGQDWRQKKGVTEDEMVGWHHQLNGHEFGQTLADGEGQGSLSCCSPWGRKELDTNEWLNNNWTKMARTWLISDSISNFCPGFQFRIHHRKQGTSLVAQLIKNLPAIRETWVRSLGWKDPLEKGKATHSSILAWRIPWTIVHGVAQSWKQLSDFHFYRKQNMHPKPVTGMLCFRSAASSFPTPPASVRTHLEPCLSPLKSPPALLCLPWSLCQNASGSGWLRCYSKLWIESLCFSSPGLPRGCTGKESACWCRRCGFDPWVGKIPWRRKWQPIPAFLPGKSHRLRSLAGYSPGGCKDLDRTERLSTHIHLSSIASFLFISTLAYFSFYKNEFFPSKTELFHPLKLIWRKYVNF